MCALPTDYVRSIVASAILKLTASFSTRRLFLYSATTAGCWPVILCPKGPIQIADIGPMPIVCYAPKDCKLDFSVVEKLSKAILCILHFEDFCLFGTLLFKAVMTKCPTLL